MIVDDFHGGASEVHWCPTSVPCGLHEARSPWPYGDSESATQRRPSGFRKPMSNPGFDLFDGLYTNPKPTQTGLDRTNGSIDDVDYAPLVILFVDPSAERVYVLHYWS